MEMTITAMRTSIEAAITEALKQKLMTNRGTFAPFRLAPTATGLVDALVTENQEAARTLGYSLGQEGLSQMSLLAAQTAIFQTIAEQASPEVVGTLIAQASQVVGATFAGLTAAEIDEVQRQRDEIERAFRSVLSTQQDQESRLRDAIRELSTPVIPIYEGILVLPLVGAIDSRRATEVTERLLEAIAEYQAELVILDITGVSIIDTSTANHLLMTTRAASLLGSQIILTGLSAEIAQSVVHLGVDLQGLITLANLQAGLAFALERFGLGILPLGKGAVHA